jgi:transposase
MRSRRKQKPATLPKRKPVAELPVGECAALIGLDWGDHDHAIALLPRGTQHPETLELKHSAESLHAWLDELKARFAGERVAIAVEASKGAIINALVEHSWLLIYPIHPATSRRFSTAFKPSGAKDDVPDAQTLLEILRYHRGRLRALLPHDPLTRQLALLTELRRKVVNHRTQLCNQLTSLLKAYYPQALELSGETRYSPLALDFVERWPELALLQRARPDRLRRFYHSHQVRRPELIEQRLEMVRTARPLTTDADLCEVSKLQVQMLIDQIRILVEHLAHLDEKLVAVFAAYPEAHLFESLPGAGAALAPRLSVLFGTDRTRWLNPVELQNYYGIAPVTEKSGRQKWVHWRWNAPCFARQSLIEWAGLTVQYSSWAKAYYLQQRKRGKPHSVILRSLAFKWLRILWRCWQDRKPYDEPRYVARLEMRNPALFALIQAA